MTFSVQPCQNEASSTPVEDPAARTCARAAAMRPSRQPRIGDHAHGLGEAVDGAVGGDHPDRAELARGRSW